MIVFETERLTLRHASLDDAAFVRRLLNEPSFLQFIGDRGVRTLDDARGYITDRFIGSYERYGFGMWVVEQKEIPGPIGICGLVKRDTLPDPDIGFAFLPEFCRAGYAYESAAGVKRHAFETLALPRLLAVINEDNASSIRLVDKLGLEFTRMIARPEGGGMVRLHTLEAGAALPGEQRPA